MKFPSADPVIVSVLGAPPLMRIFTTVALFAPAETDTPITSYRDHAVSVQVFVLPFAVTVSTRVDAFQLKPLFASP